MEIELKEIPNHPFYFASRDGKIWTTKRKGGNARASGQVGPPRLLSVCANRSGYLRVNFDTFGKNETKLIHRLVLETFVGPAPSGHHGCHYPDANKSNNMIENLRWDTPLENARDKFRDRPIAEEKKCRRCAEVKKLSFFYKDKRASDGVQGECKYCHRKIGKLTQDPEKRRISNRNYMRRKRAYLA